MSAAPITGGNLQHPGAVGAVVHAGTTAAAHSLGASAPNSVCCGGANLNAAGMSVVIPVYNGALTLSELVEQLELVLPTLSSDYEIILVNDGSRDASWATIEALAQAHPCIRGIDLMRNYGQHNAV